MADQTFVETNGDGKPIVGAAEQCQAKPTEQAKTGREESLLP